MSVDSVRGAWDHYRNDIKPSSDEAQQWRRDNALTIAGPESYVPTARFIGVWDTVGSLGVPIRRLRKRYDFHDVTLTSYVDHAYHALAIDEQRRDYEPTLWAQSEQARAQRLEQRWFAGSHSDVGGGAAHEGRDAQSDYCLAWLLDRAVEVGLDVDRDAVAWHEPPPGRFPRLHLNPGFLFRLIALIREPRRRPIGQGIPKGKTGYGQPSYETVDEQARRRLSEDPRYNPKNLIGWEAEQPSQL